MGWNGSNTNSQERQKPSESKRQSISCLARGSLVGLIVLILLSFVVFWFATRSENPSQVEEPPNKLNVQITNAGTNLVIKKKVEGVPKKPHKKTDAERLKYYQDKYGDNLPDNLKPIVYYLKNPPKKNFRPKSDPLSIFKHSSEREIASVLTCEPGTWIFRLPVYDASFDKDFAQAMIDKIEFSPDDTPEQRELKQSVIDAKKQLAERLKGGEMPSQIMNEMAKALYDLGQYRSEISDAIREFKNDPTKSDRDVADYIDAANVMLKKKGLKPIGKPNMTLRHITLKRNQEKKMKEQEKTK